jgi:hypothetical protein
MSTLPDLFPPRLTSPTYVLDFFSSLTNLLIALLNLRISPNSRTESTISAKLPEILPENYRKITGKCLPEEQDENSKVNYQAFFLNSLSFQQKMEQNWSWWMHFQPVAGERILFIDAELYREHCLLLSQCSSANVQGRQFWFPNRQGFRFLVIT